MATYKPGEKAPDSGELIEVGPRGGKVEGGRQTVIERGEKIPPTSEPGNEFRYTRGSKTTHEDFPDFKAGAGQTAGFPYSENLQSL